MNSSEFIISITLRQKSGKTPFSRTRGRVHMERSRLPHTSMASCSVPCSLLPSGTLYHTFTLRQKSVKPYPCLLKYNSACFDHDTPEHTEHIHGSDDGRILLIVAVQPEQHQKSHTGIHQSPAIMAPGRIIPSRYNCVITTDDAQFGISPRGSNQLSHNRKSGKQSRQRFLSESADHTV